MGGTWGYGSEDSDEHRFHPPVDNMAVHFRAVTSDPQDEPEFTGCSQCGVEDCVGSRPLVDCPARPARQFRPEVDTGWGLDDPDDDGEAVCRSCGEPLPDTADRCVYCEDWDPRGENDGVSAAYLAAEHRDRDRI